MASLGEKDVDLMKGVSVAYGGNPLVKDVKTVVKHFIKNGTGK